ncbi:MAG: DUF6448 family protein [Candidatus Marinimicrobia bacterium]|nr:DUF6448 family protein [Candidatus Neomarinimicrobiota bacterium]MCF7904192.1 DUF6448 family protein [Candidatus Neomarinimicrobiota bacterium]
MMVWLLPMSSPLMAHCDSMDGPIITEAKVAIATNDLSLVLKWVSSDQEHELRTAFDQTLKVRTLSPQAADLADRFFFETLIRLHRETEGAPYTGLKPAGQIGPAVGLADKALESGRVAHLSNKISKAVKHEIESRHEIALKKQKSATQSVAAGREYVEAYVGYVHFVEAVHNMMSAEHGSHNKHDKH